jgi:hypothetical protein
MTSLLSPPLSDSRSLSIAQRRFLRNQSLSQSPRTTLCRRPSTVIPSPIITTSPTFMRHTSCDDGLQKLSRWSPESHRYSSASASFQSSVAQNISITSEGYSSDSSIDIIRAHRETVKKAQPHLVKWQSPSVSDHEDDNEDWDYDDVLQSYEDESGEQLDGWQQNPSTATLIQSSSECHETSDASMVKKRYGMPPEEFLQEQNADMLTMLQQASPNLPISYLQGSAEGDAATSDYLSFCDDEMDCKRTIQAEPMKSERPRRSERKLEDSGSSHRRAASKVEATAFLHFNASHKTSFFHHSTLRRHNSTDNYARAQLKKRLSENQADAIPPLRVAVRQSTSSTLATPHATPRCSSRFRETSSGHAADAGANEYKRGFRNSFGPLTKSFDVIKVSEKLLYTKSKVRQQEVPNAHRSDRSPMPRSKMESEAGPSTSPILPFFLRKVQSMQHINIPRSPLHTIHPLKTLPAHEHARAFTEGPSRANRFSATEAESFAASPVFKSTSKSSKKPHFCFTGKIFGGMKRSSMK